MEYVKKLELAILVVIAIVCVWRFFTKERDDLVLAPFSGMSVSVEGVIVSEPELRANGTRVLLDVGKISILKEVPQVIEGDKHFVLATVQTSIDLSYGDLIEIEGKLERPEIIVGDDGRSFDYPHYLGKDGIYFLLKGNKVTRISRHQGSRVKEYLFRVKQAFIDRINESMPEPYSLLASGIVVAGKGALSDDLEEQFKRVGLIHIVVLSGSNVTIIAEAITRVLSLLPKYIAAAGGIFGIIAFTIIAGTSATVVRSAIMSIVAVLAKTFGRSTDALRALVIAACGMTLLNPDIVLYDPSFQLSFTGTLGLILLGDQTSRWFRWIPERGGLREIVSASVASQISITPMILHMSGMFSFVSLLVNILVLPLLPLTMLMVFVTGCLRFISSVLSVPTLVVSYALLGYELKIVDFFSSWQYAATTIPALSWLAVFGIYAMYILIYMAYRIYRKSHQ